ncbi:MAG: LDCC motif putative metal-binding protein [bacterium]
MIKWIKKWLGKLAESNEKNFGGQSPDCCGGTKVHPKPETRPPENKEVQEK